MIASVLIVLFAYLCGSISTAVWYGRHIHGVDIRDHGSGNAGATNSLRVLGRTAGILVLIIDFIKGLLPVLLAKYLDFGEEIIPFVGFAAIIGHLLPVFAGFRGGKGVATAMGVVVAVIPPAALVCLTVFLLCLLLTRYVSLGSLLAAVSLPLSVFIFDLYTPLTLLFAVAVALLLAFTHRKNIERLLQGVETKLGQKA